MTVVNLRLGSWLLALAVLSCKHADDHSHDHHGHDREHAVEEPEPLSITKWTDGHELFVEFPPPVSGRPVAYHAHVTKLDGFAALTEGTFTVRYKTASGVAAEAKVQGVKRAGIFTPEGPAPVAGTYSLEMVVEYGSTRDVFDCGSITIESEPRQASPPEGGGALTFLKEAQWKVPFGTTWAEVRALAQEVELPAVVEPAGSDQLVIGAPTGGRFFHNPKALLAEGRRIHRGDVIGTIAPNVAGEDYSRLQLAVEEARLGKVQAEREIQRIEPLVKQQLLPERRLIELRNELETHNARLNAAKSRFGLVLAPGGAGGISIASTLAGEVSQVLARNGEPVEAGAPLIRVGGTTNLWMRMKFVAKPASHLHGAQPTGLRLPTGERLNLEGTGAKLLSAVPAVDPSSRIATWILAVPDEAAVDKGQGQSRLHAGSSVIVLLRIGEPRSVLAVPREAIVEINTRPFVFVQADGEHFDKRAVTLGRVDGGFVEVTSGLSQGERIVTKGGFDVHLASLMGSVESHRH